MSTWATSLAAVVAEVALEVAALHAAMVSCVGRGRRGSSCAHVKNAPREPRAVSGDERGQPTSGGRTHSIARASLEKLRFCAARDAAVGITRAWAALSIRASPTTRC